MSSCRDEVSSILVIEGGLWHLESQAAQPVPQGVPAAPCTGVLPTFQGGSFPSGSLCHHHP